jgi:hypothetical protein
MSFCFVGWRSSLDFAFYLKNQTTIKSKRQCAASAVAQKA